MEIRIDRQSPVPVAFLSGDVSAEDGDRLVDQLQPLIAQKGKRLAVEMSGLEAMNSIALSGLISVVTLARMRESRVVLVAPTPFVSGVLEVTQLDQWFEICADLDEMHRRFDNG